jgi:cytochrome P450
MAKMISNLATAFSSVLLDKSALVVFALASLVTYYVTTTFFAWRRLRHFPGPPLAHISYLWSFWTVFSGDCHTKIAAAQKKYGKVMRVGPNAIMIYDPETFWYMNSARSSYTRSGWYESMKFHPGGDSVLSEMDTAAHDRRKANLLSGFAGKGSVNLEADVDSRLSALVNFIRFKTMSGQTLEFSQTIRWFQLDLITLAAFGEPWGDLADEKDHFKFLKTMDLAMRIIHSISVSPFLRKFVFSKFFLTLAAPKVTDKEGMGRSIRRVLL